VFWKYGVAGRCQRFTRKENLRNDITPIKIRTKNPGSCLLKTARLPGLTGHPEAAAQNSRSGAFFWADC
jgi:hypothetical protein